jgi:ubiquinone/menaquinone biosynthesis C-methylase UbiE
MTLSTTETEQPQATYALGHTAEEYERLRMQARVWEVATGRLLDQVGLGPGASCLDAGCGPGETMRAMAGRVGPAGRVLGVDADPALGAMTLAMLRGAGHRQCTFQAQDLTAAGPIPGAPFDLVYARLLLFHLPQRVEVLARLWDAVAPGGHLLIQDYDLRNVSTLPELDWGEELLRVLTGAFGAVGADVSAGARLPQLFAQAGVGTPDGTDVAGRIEPLATGRSIMEGTLRSLLPTALAHGVTTERGASQVLAAIDRDATRFPDSQALWPLLIGAWKRKEQA